MEREFKDSSTSIPGKRKGEGSFLSRNPHQSSFRKLGLLLRAALRRAALKISARVGPAVVHRAVKIRCSRRVLADFQCGTMPFSHPHERTVADEVRVHVNVGAQTCPIHSLNAHKGR
jgi:hypothetical protein